MKPITAAQARDMNPANAVSAHLGQIFQSIEAAATKGETRTRFPYSLTEVRGEGSVHPKGAVGAGVAKALVDLGYKIDSHWECGQFVDAYLTIEWGADNA